MSESDNIEMTSRRRDARGGKGRELVELAQTLRALSTSINDHYVAGLLEDVVARVDRYAEAPTRDQMAAALGAAELGVHVRLDDILAGVKAIREGEQERASQFATFGKQMSALTSDVRRICELVDDLDTRLKKNEKRLDEQTTLIGQATDERVALSSQIAALAEQFSSMRRIVEELLSQRPILTEEQVRRYIALIEQHERQLRTMAGESGGGSGGA